MGPFTTVQAVEIAAAEGFAPIIELLVAAGAPLGPALFGAAAGGHVELVKSLVSKRAPLNWQNKVCDW